MMTQNWKSRKIRKAKFAGAGNTQKKGVKCQKDPQRAYFFCNPKAVKHKDYPRYHELAKAWNR